MTPCHASGFISDHDLSANANPRCRNSGATVTAVLTPEELGRLRLEQILESAVPSAADRASVLRRALRRLDRLAFLGPVASAVSFLFKPRVAVAHLRRTLGVQ